jgi:hypothetical protein
MTEMPCILKGVQLRLVPAGYKSLPVFLLNHQHPMDDFTDIENFMISKKCRTCYAFLKLSQMQVFWPL